MKYSIKSSHLCRLLLAGTALTLAMPVAAQTASKPAAAEAEADIDAIVVTARKQNETALEVPIAISAFSAASIQDKLTTGISDIADFTPGSRCSNPSAADSTARLSAAHRTSFKLMVKSVSS